MEQIARKLGVGDEAADPTSGCAACRGQPQIGHVVFAGILEAVQQAQLLNHAPGDAAHSGACAVQHRYLCRGAIGLVAEVIHHRLWDCLHFVKGCSVQTISAAEVLQIPVGVHPPVR